MDNPTKITGGKGNVLCAFLHRLRRFNLLKYYHTVSVLLVESGFSGERKRNLWRLEYLGDRLYLLILSPDRPDLSIGVRRYGFPDDENAYQTKDYTPLLERVKNDTWWHFKLVANPTRSVASTPGERGKVKAHCSLKYQEEWLLDRAQKHGFELLPENFQIVERDWHIFRKGKEQGKNKVSIKGVTYEGILKVCDEEKFKELLVAGIGRGKAYGMGLLTIVHI